jgi:hypothetical protein
VRDVEQLFLINASQFDIDTSKELPEQQFVKMQENHALPESLLATLAGYSKCNLAKVDATYG